MRRTEVNQNRKEASRGAADKGGSISPPIFPLEPNRDCQYMFALPRSGRGERRSSSVHLIYGQIENTEKTRDVSEWALASGTNRSSFDHWHKQRSGGRKAQPFPQETKSQASSTSGQPSGRNVAGVSGHFASTGRRNRSLGVRHASSRCRQRRLRPRLCAQPAFPRARCAVRD